MRENIPLVTAGVTAQLYESSTVAIAGGIRVENRWSLHILSDCRSLRIRLTDNYLRLIFRRRGNVFFLSLEGRNFAPLRWTWRDGAFIQPAPHAKIFCRTA